MKYALVDGQKVEATKGMKGVCPICLQPVIPKCGHFKISHWAHKSLSHCDKWWESETEWHRNWKNMFQNDWQEIVAFDDKTGEKHIADIKTRYGLVVEFQHSYISEEERISREMFYKNMIWVVDGTRRKQDFERFCSLLEHGDIFQLPRTDWFIIKNGLNSFPKEWQHSRVPVFFDFMGKRDPEDTISDQRRIFLWCLLPIYHQKYCLSVMLAYSKEQLVKNIIDGSFGFNYKEMINIIQSSKRNKIQINCR